MQVIKKPALSNLSEDIQEDIENIWQRESKIPGRYLFNGKILSLVNLEKDKLICEFVEYKYYLAQLRDPSLERFLNIKTVCVSAITLAGNRVLVGHRARSLTVHPGLYELAPSGGIDPTALENGKIDLIKQYMVELEEETGILKDHVKKVNPFALLYEPTMRCYEICAEIHIDPNHTDVSKGTHEEYDELFWLPMQDVPKFIINYRDRIVPLSLWLLKESKV